MRVCSSCSSSASVSAVGDTGGASEAGRFPSSCSCTGMTTSFWSRLQASTIWRSSAVVAAWWLLISLVLSNRDFRKSCCRRLLFTVSVMLASCSVTSLRLIFVTSARVAVSTSSHRGFRVGKASFSQSGCCERGEGIMSAYSIGICFSFLGESM